MLTAASNEHAPD